MMKERKKKNHEVEGEEEIVMKYIFNVIQESNNDVLRTITEVFYCVDGADCNGLVKGERNSNSRRS